MEALKALLAKYSFSKEPVMWMAMLAAVAFTLYKVYGPDHMPWSDVMTEDYAVYITGLMGALIARVQVFTKDAHEKGVAKAIENELNRR